MSPRSILIIGNYGAGNLGDDAILAGILTDLKALGYRGKITVTHGGNPSSPELYKGLHKVPFLPSGIRSRFSRRRKEVETVLRTADLVILGGGGLFMDTESRLAPWIWASQARACHSFKVPYICYGQSVGPLKTAFNRFLTRQTFHRAKAVHVRDAASQELLKSWGVQATLGTDAALSWLQQERKSTRKEAVLLINLRLWPGVDTLTWTTLLTPILEFARHKKWKPILITMDLKNEEEKAALKALDLEFFEPPSAAAAFEGFQKAQIAVTMRLHAGIFSVSAGIPTLALSYSTKVSAFFKSLDPKTLILGTKEWNAKTLKKNLEKLKKTPHFDAETPIMKNRAFLAEALEL